MLDGHGGNIYEMARRHGCLKENIIDMSSNINPLGPPPGLLDHLNANLSVTTRLPEVDSGETIKQYAEHLSINPERILAGNGTTQFIYSIPQVLNIRRALIVGPTYSDYADACNLHQITASMMIASESADFCPDLSRLEKKLDCADTVFLCNPNNPTGSYISPTELKRLCRRHLDTRFIIDESYLPFVDQGQSKSMIHSGLENVVVLLSISKIFAIPGLRIGFLVGSSNFIDKFKRHLMPWSVNSLSQAAVHYLTAHNDLVQSFVDKTRHYIRLQREEFFRTFKFITPIKLYPSATPFFLARLPDTISSDWVWSCLANEKVLIRNCSNFPGLSDRFIRISLKTWQANRMLAERLVTLVVNAVNTSLPSENSQTVRV